MAAGRADRRPRSAVDPRSPAHEENALLVAPGDAAGARGRHSAAARTIRRCAATLARAARAVGARNTRWARRAERLEALFARGDVAADDFRAPARAGPLPGLPRRRSARDAGSAPTLACSGCGRQLPGGPSRDFLDLRPHESSSREQTKYLDEALHADARHERVSPPLLGRRSATTCCARSSRPGPATASSISAAAAAGRCCGTATRAPRPSAIDIAPYFADEARREVDLLLGDLRRLPFADGTFTKAWSLDVLEHLSPEALRGMLAEAARVLAPGGALFVYTHVRKNAPIAAGLRCDQRLARRLERAGLIDMRQERLRKSDHLNPLRTSRSSSRSSRDGRLPHRADPLLHADRRRVRREHPDADGRAGDDAARRAAHRRRGRSGTTPQARAIRDARARRRNAIAHQPATRRGVARAVVAHEARPAAVRRIRSGRSSRSRKTGRAAVRPHHDPARSSRSREISGLSRDREDPLLRHRSDRARHHRRIGARRGGGAKGWRRSATRCTCWSRRARPFPAGRVTLDRRWRRRSAARSCAGCAARGARASRARLAPDVVIERYHNFGGEGIVRGQRRSARRRCSKSTRRSIDHPGSPKALARSRAARRADAPLARAHLRARPT